MSLAVSGPSHSHLAHYQLLYRTQPREQEQEQDQEQDQERVRVRVPEAMMLAVISHAH